MRIGEAWKLKWIDIDFVNSTVRVTPEKGSHARMFKISSKLIAMISAHPRKSDKLFGNYDLKGFRSSFIKSTKKNRTQTWKPTYNPNNFPHIPPLESHNGIPQNQRHPSRHATTRPQKHQKHPHLHAASNIRR